MNFLASPPLVVAYALAGNAEHRPHDRAAGHGQGRQAGLSQGHLAERGRSRENRGRVGRLGDVQEGLRQRIQRRRATGAASRLPAGKIYAWDGKSTYVKNPPYFDGMTHDAGSGRGHQGRARPGRARRLGDHRPHLTGRQHLQVQPGGEIPDRAGRAAGGLQFLRRAARQPRGHDARHLRQHPSAQSTRCRAPRAASRCTSRAASRCRSSTPRCKYKADGDAAGHPRRQGIWHRLVARLGGQGHDAAGREGGDRRELRAHPPLQPHRHGRAAAAVQGRTEHANRSASRARSASTSSA